MPADIRSRSDVGDRSLQTVAESSLPSARGGPAAIRENRARADCAPGLGGMFSELLDGEFSLLVAAEEGGCFAVVAMSHDVENRRGRCERHADRKDIPRPDKLDLRKGRVDSNVDIAQRGLHERHRSVEVLVQA